MGTSYRVGEFEVQPQARCVLRGGAVQPLGARALDLLIVLIERRDRVVGKDELLLSVWPGVIVEENNLTVQMSAIRKVLGPGLITTVPGRGYRFIGKLDGDDTRMPTAGHTPGPTRVAQSPLRSNLPALLPPLIGRADELRALDALVARQRLVTVLGAGGIGKTTLARHLLAGRLHALAHGGCWADLAPLTDAASLPATLAAALGITLGGGEAQAALADALASLQLLLVLDNAEHLAASVAALVQALLARSPGLQVLVTSQVPLRMPDEQLYRLAPLALPAAGTSNFVHAADAADFGAVSLFVTRAQAVQRPFALDDGNASAVVGLCESLDGNALAIELAASRLPLLGLKGLVDGLSERLRLLRAAPHGGPARRHSVMAALEWSYGLLPAREQRVFRGLAVFAGAAALGPIQAVLCDEPGVAAATVGDGSLADGWAVIDALAELVDRSLVAVTADEPPRYRLLESPRAWAREKLAMLGAHESERLRRRHAQAFAEQAERQIRLAPVDADVDDLRVALAWACDHDIAAALIIGARLEPSIKRVSIAEQGALQHTLETLLAHADAAAASRRAALARSALGMLLCDSQPATAARHAADAAAWFADHGGREDHYLACCHQALAQGRMETEAAQRTLETLLSLQDPTWSALTLARGAHAEAKVAHFAGDAARARAALQRQVRLRESIGEHHHGELANLVMIERKAGNVMQALELGLALVEQLRGTREERSLHYARLNLAGAAVDLKNGRLWRDIARDAWPAVQRFGLYRAWLYRLLDFTQAEGRTGVTQRLAHATLALRDDGQVPVSADERADIERMLLLAQQGWSAADRERLRREGLALTSDDVLALVLAEGDAG